MRHVSAGSVSVLVCFLASLAAAQAASPKTPTFFARRDYGGLASTSIQVADTNGDGIPDLISNFDGIIAVLFGNGDGTFRYGPLNSVACCSPFFTAMDLNGDGNVDLVLGTGIGIAVSMGNGDGTFQPATAYLVNDSGSGFLALGDFNGDGILDAVITGAMGVWLFTGKGDGTFNPGVLAAALSQGPSEIAAADFNDDNKLDLVVTLTGVVHGLGGGSVVLLGNGDGTFQAPRTLGMPQNPIGVAAGSLAKAGPAGIAIGDADSSNVYLYFGNGAGGFSKPQPINLPGVNFGGLAIGDVNGDGVPDLVSSAVSVAYGKGGGRFSSPRSYPANTAGGTLANVLLTGLRNNGQTDIVTSGHYAISVLLNEGNGKFEDGIWTAVNGGAACGVAADFNGDGKPDIAVNNPQGITILLGTGNPAKPLTAGTPITLANAGCLVTGDLNGDGKPDLLVPVNGTVVAYLGNGDGTFNLASTTASPSGGFLALGDFNHDGKLDFATSGNLLALGNGDGTFQTPTDIVANPPSVGFSGIAAGDINNDGWTDLVLCINADDLSHDDNAFVLLNNREAGFTKVPANFGALTHQPILADLNGDGNLDLVLQTAVGDAEIHLGDGTGGFSAGQGLLGLEQIAGFNIVADFNGDGIPDIGILQGDTLEIYFGKGAATYAAPFYIGTGPYPGGLLVANLHGQSPGKGVPDIVVPDTSGGVMVLLNLTK